MAANGRKNSILLWVGVLVGFLALTVAVYWLSQWLDKTPFDWVKSVTKLGGGPFCNVLGAFAIGALGSWAFLIGVASGLVARGQRSDLLTYLDGELFLQAVFVLIGGAVAAVFQAGQATSFAPIQALVIGSTWPTVISQYLAGQGQPANQNSVVLSKLATESAQKGTGSSGELLGAPPAAGGGAPPPPNTP
jgi:hypothetical protein